MHKADKNNISRKRIVDHIVEQSAAIDDLPEDLNEMIRSWFANDHDRSLKEEALMKVFDSDFQLAEQPSKQLFEALPALKQRLGISGKPKMPLYKKMYFRVAVAAAVITIVFGISFILRKDDKGNAPIMALEDTIMSAETEEIYTPVMASNAVEPTGTEEIYIPIAAFDTMIPAERKEEVNIPFESLDTAGHGKDKGTRKIELADGSQIWLGENSTVEYPDDFLNDRTVILKGEAYFSVAKMEGKPFQVKADDLTVRVLGTEFFVRTAAKSGQTEVSLSSGKIEIIRHDVVYELSPLEQLLLDNITNEVIRNIVDDEYIVQYKTPETETIAVPVPISSQVLMLYDVFSEIANAYNVQFEIEDGLNLDTEIIIHIDNTLPLEELLSIIRMVAGTPFDFSINEAGSTVRITKR